MITDQTNHNLNNTDPVLASSVRTLKLLIIINVCLAAVFVVQQFGINCFCFGGYPPLAILGGIFLMLMPFLLLVFLLVIGFDLYYIFRLWPIARSRSLLPLGILITGIGVGICSGGIGHKIAFSYFDRHYEEYSAAVNFIMQSDNVKAAALPSRYEHLTFMGHVIAQEGESMGEKNIVLEFMVGSGGFAGHTAYLYSSSGQIAENSPVARRWPHRTKVRDNLVPRI